MRKSGRHFVQIPGPTNVPDRILHAIARPTMDHRSAEFAELAKGVLDRTRTVFKTSGPVFIYPSSATGAWEAALVNTLASGDRVLMFETGHFATLWSELARRLGLRMDLVPGDWRSGADIAAGMKILEADRSHEIKAVCVVHNETSTGCASPIPALRQAMNACGHPALLMVDTVSSLASMDFRQDEWGVDVTVAGSQKGLMLPPGLSFNAVSAKALEASRRIAQPVSYWSWAEMQKLNAAGFFPYTPATNLLYGLAEAIDMLHEEGLDTVFARHHRHGEATRRAVRAWGLEVLCQNPDHYSSSLTAVVMPEGHSADAFRKIVAARYNMSLGNGLSKLADRVFRIGHLGDLNDIMLCAALSGVEMGLANAGVPHKPGGLQAALEFLKGNEFGRA